jgi:hypothetical protein
MAALTANAVTPPRHDPGSPKFEVTFKAHAADVFYLGALCAETAGRVHVPPADGENTIGICLSPVTTTAQDDPVRVHVRGIWWFAAAGCTDANLMQLMAPLATSDNPADILAQGAATPFALGELIHVDVTATSGWVDLGVNGHSNA